MSRGEQLFSPMEQVRLQIHFIGLTLLFLCEIDKGPHIGMPPLSRIHTGLLMIIHHVAHCDLQFLQLPPPLPVNLESLKDLILFAVVFEYSAHVMEHSGGRHRRRQEGHLLRLFCQCRSTDISLCGRAPQQLHGQIPVPWDTGSQQMQSAQGVLCRRISLLRCTLQPVRSLLCLQQRGQSILRERILLFGSQAEPHDRLLPAH